MTAASTTGDINVTAGGALTANTVTATSGDVSLTSTTSTISGPGVVSGNTLDLQASTGIGPLNTAVTNLNANTTSGTITVNEADDANVNITSPGTVTLSSLAGSLTGTVTAATSQLIVDAGNDINLNTTIASLDAGAGGNITINETNGLTINDVDTPNTFNLTASGNVNSGASRISTGTANIDAGTGQVNIQTDATNLNVTGGNSIFIDELDDVNLGVTGSGSATVLAQSGGNPNITGITGATVAVLNATGDVTGGTINSSTVAINTAVNVDITTNVTLATINATGNVTVNDTNSLSIDATGSGDFNASAGSGVLNIAGATGFTNITATTPGQVTSGVTLVAPGTLTVSSGTGPLTLTTDAGNIVATSAGDMTISEADAVSANLTTTAGNIDLSNSGVGNITFTGNATGGNILVNSTSDLIVAGSITNTAGRDTTLIASGAVTGGLITTDLLTVATG